VLRERTLVYGRKHAYLRLGVLLRLRPARVRQMIVRRRRRSELCVVIPAFRTIMGWRSRHVRRQHVGIRRRLRCPRKSRNHAWERGDVPRRTLGLTGEATESAGRWKDGRKIGKETRVKRMIVEHWFGRASTGD
jgi:hypothetical protein